MATKLEEILNTIDPKNWIKKEQKANEILAGFKINTNTIESEDEFLKVITDFMIKLSFPPNFTEEIDDPYFHFFSLAIELLKKEYPDSTRFTVYNIMNTGAEGGVYQVLKTLTRLWVDDVYIGEFKHQIAVHLNKFSYEERERAAKEYIEKFKDILPANYKNNPGTIVGFLDKVLLEHAIMMKRMREIKKFVL
jgi:hypothetical protein